MRNAFGVLILTFAAGACLAADLPGWAYGYPPGGPPPAGAAAPGRGRGGAAAAPDTSPKKLPGSPNEFTLAQIRDGNGPADWYPGDHPTMPEIVAHGRKDANITACALCHYPNGKGRAENAPVSGYPVAYFVQTMMDFKNGIRKSSDARKANAANMARFAKAMTDEEIKTAAEYFGAIKWTPWIKVVETAQVPKTRIAGGLFVALPGDEKEPLGTRVIEVPENAEASETLRDPHSGFIAYAPVGSIKKGEALVTTGGGGKTVACGNCHGADLKGLGPVPGIAGRSPSYMARQMFDIQQGSRSGVWSELMKPAMAKLTEEDMVNIVAYLASRTP